MMESSPPGSINSRVGGIPADLLQVAAPVTWRAGSRWEGFHQSLAADLNQILKLGCHGNDVLPL